MTESNHHSTPEPELTLYVKAGQGGQGFGACPFCQQIHMILALKGQEYDGKLFEVVVIDPGRPPAEFRKHANRLPVLKHGDEVLTENEEIINYIDKNFPEPDLSYSDQRAHTVCLDVFSKFAHYIKQVSTSPDHLISELWRVSDHMVDSGNKFLCGDKLTHLDCLMLPKLQHIRVAALAFRNFHIPSTMIGIWRYLWKAYKEPIFQVSLPSDQEIVYHWSCKSETPLLSEEKKRIYSIDGEPRYDVSLPDGYKIPEDSE